LITTHPILGLARHEPGVPVATTRGYLRLLFALFGAVSFATAQTVPVPPTQSICQLFEDLRSHDGKQVSVRGVLYQSMEIFALGAHCDDKARFATTYNWAPALQGLPDTPPTGRYTWPTALDLKSASWVEDGEEPVRFQTDLDAWKRVNGVIDAQLVRLGLSEREVEISVTVVGQLRLKKRYEVGKSQDGTVRGGGYGHFGIYPAQLVIKTVADPEVSPKKQHSK
jgi:hypothetical protein